MMTLPSSACSSPLLKLSDPSMWKEHSKVSGQQRTPVDREQGGKPERRFSRAGCPLWHVTTPSPPRDTAAV
ncbi:Hypothetical predicted protein [Podarcis lilfordi]|uniref:Uncharacterized protein n=1 Tax=Podarcis lilfordi TaxID=74358 RepID=A0AA35P845_9SAUR|nr:Hypothetical predicted protein [Podarcis lilfordi]